MTDTTAEAEAMYQAQMVWLPPFVPASAPLHVTKGSFFKGGIELLTRQYGVKLALHGAHHPFGTWGKLPHIQLTLWQKGVKNSDQHWRVAIPWPRR